MELRNAEHYPDPTAAKAIANLTSVYRPVVYIASPFSGDMERNTERARGYCRFAVSKGCIPIAPHLLYPQFMDETDKEERELGLFFAIVLLGKCEELWVFGDRISEGMGREIIKAQKRGMPIRYFTNRCEEVGAKLCIH
jgi:hypothetical protein